VLSNDPDEPSMSVSAHLEVEMPFPNITVTPDSLNEHLFSGDSSIQSIVISNDGIADLNWNLNILDYGRDGTAYTFTNCGNEGFIGPSQQDCDDEYQGTLLEGIVTVAEGIQEWVVPHHCRQAPCDFLYHVLPRVVEVEELAVGYHLIYPVELLILEQNLR